MYFNFEGKFYNQLGKNYYHFLLCQFTYSILFELKAKSKKGYISKFLNILF